MLIRIGHFTMAVRPEEILYVTKSSGEGMSRIGYSYGYRGTDSTGITVRFGMRRKGQTKEFEVYCPASAVDEIDVMITDIEIAMSTGE